MNRKEDLINYLYKELFDPANEEVGFDRVVSTIRKYEERPLTLADLLGWDEGVEYEGEYKGRYKIENGVLWNFSALYGKWCIFSFNWADEVIKELQQAKKVEKKPKAYHVKDEYSYKCLMKELEEQGGITRYGTKPTEIDYWRNHKQKTVIYCDEDKKITYSDLSYYGTYLKDKYDLVEYHKVETLYYAIDRIGKLDNDNSYYLVRFYDEFSEKYYYGNIGKESADKLTKTEWNKLGINDTNADWEEVAE